MTRVLGARGRKNEVRPHKSDKKSGSHFIADRGQTELESKKLCKFAKLVAIGYF